MTLPIGALTTHRRERGLEKVLRALELKGNYPKSSVIRPDPTPIQRLRDQTPRPRQ